MLYLSKRGCFKKIFNEYLERSVRFTQECEIITVPDASLWTTRQGNGPALVCCHGGPGLWDYLGSVAEMVDDLVMAYRYYQRACGRSTGGPPYYMTIAVADLDALRDHWNLPQWIVLGHSWGATKDSK